MRRISASASRPVSSIVSIAASARSGIPVKQASGRFGLNDHRRDRPRDDRMQLASDPRALAGDRQSRASLALGDEPSGGSPQLAVHRPARPMKRPEHHAAIRTNNPPATSQKSARPIRQRSSAVPPEAAAAQAMAQRQVRPRGDCVRDKSRKYAAISGTSSVGTRRPASKPASSVRDYDEQER